MQCSPYGRGALRALSPTLIGAHFDDHFEFGVEDGNDNVVFPQWVASFNACTLWEPAKRKSFERQWSELKYLAIGFQEARSRKTQVYESELFWIVSASANQKGGLGPELWLSKSRPLGRKFGRKIIISRPMITLFLADERRLIVKLLTPLYVVIFAVFHAPHGLDLQVAQRWYEDTTALMMRLIPVGTQRVVMIDANARSPIESSSAVGLDGATTESRTTRDFESFALASGLWAPATFAECVNRRKL